MVSLFILDVSVEVYFIVAFLAALIFFPLLLIVGKFVRNTAKKVIATVLGTIILAPILYVCLITAWILSITYYPNQSFEREQWVADEFKRYEMSKDIIDSQLLIGKTKGEVIQILGEDRDKNEMQSNKWFYHLGFTPGIGNIDPSFLIIYFEDDKVVKVEQHQS